MEMVGNSLLMPPNYAVQFLLNVYNRTGIMCEYHNTIQPEDGEEATTPIRKVRFTALSCRDMLLEYRTEMNKAAAHFNEVCEGAAKYIEKLPLTTEMEPELAEWAKSFLNNYKGGK